MSSELKDSYKMSLLSCERELFPCSRKRPLWKFIGEEEVLKCLERELEEDWKRRGYKFGKGEETEKSPVSQMGGTTTTGKTQIGELEISGIKEMSVSLMGGSGKMERIELGKGEEMMSGTGKMETTRLGELEIKNTPVSGSGKMEMIVHSIDDAMMNVRARVAEAFAAEESDDEESIALVDLEGEAWASKTSSAEETGSSDVETPGVEEKDLKGDGDVGDDMDFKLETGDAISFNAKMPGVEEDLKGDDMEGAEGDKVVVVVEEEDDDVEGSEEDKTSDDMGRRSGMDIAKYPPSLMLTGHCGWATAKDSIDICDHIRTEFLVTKNDKKVPVGDLKGKYVLIACFLWPYECKDSEVSRAMIHLSKERPAIEEVKFVIVAKMRPGFGEEDFKHSFSGFPDHFLTVPYEDSFCRDFVTWSFGIPALPTKAGVILDLNGEVLQRGLFFLNKFGANAFPFSETHHQDLLVKDAQLKLRLDPFSRHFAAFHPGCIYGEPPYFAAEFLLASHLPLDPLTPADLRCWIQHLVRTNDCVKALHPFDDGALIGLYLCYDGGFMKRLGELSKKFERHDPAFKVVVVPLAFTDDPDLFSSHISHALRELGISSWSSICYEDKICRMLWRISGMPKHDSLILLPSKLNSESPYSGEIQAHAVTSLVGDRVYPFTREALFNERLSYVRGFTIKSLAETYGPVYRSNNKYEPISAESLLNKEIILCLDRVGAELFNILADQYAKIKEIYPNCEVVFVPTRSESEGLSVELDPKLDWLILVPADGYSLPNRLFAEDLGESVWTDQVLCTYGLDGRIFARKAEIFLMNGDIASLFNYHLQEEIFTIVSGQLQDKDDTFKY